MTLETTTGKPDAAAQQERLFSTTMIESMPGVLYFYDETGRFLRWNKNFEIVSGYSGEEIARMHPLDFFGPGEKELVAWRIAEVLEKGASSVEARLLSKDGTVTPFFFTGRRVEFDGLRCLVGMGIDISERLCAEQALQESEHRLQALFEQAPLGMTLVESATGRILKMNAEFCKIAGYPMCELVNRPFQTITHPEDMAGDEERKNRLRESQPPAIQFQKRYIRKDGSIVWVRVTSVPLAHAPGMMGQHISMVEDITERKQFIDRLAESERKYRELVEMANSIILRWDTQGCVTFLNEFGQRFFGYTAAEIVGRNVMDVIVPPRESGGRDLQTLMEQIRENPAAFEQNVNENIRRNGDRVWIAWTNRIVYDAEGKVTEILSIGTDITARRRAEEEIRELNVNLERRVAERTAELNAARLQAEAADRLKSAFLATMSHELRTPLNSIIGFTGILLQELAGPLTPEQTKQLGMVQGSARHLLELINDVLDLSKIEAGQLEVRSERFDLRESIERTAALVRPLAEKKRLTLETVIAPEIGAMLSDRRRVEQILLNLLNNAIKFTEKGGVTLTAALVDDFQFAPEAAPVRAVRLAVRDTGIGLKPADLAMLFIPFRQVDSGLGRQHEGTGLGLAICRRLATLLHGEISVESEWAQGSQFTVTIPLGL